MLEIEVSQTLDLLQAKFPKMDKAADMLARWAELFRRKPAEVVKEAILRHRESCSFHNPQKEKILGHIREIEAENAPAGGTRADKPLWVSIREHLGLPDSTHPYEVWLRYYRALWINKARCRESYRSQIRSGCYNALVAAGMATTGEKPDFEWAKWAAELPFDEEGEFNAGVAKVLAEAPRANSEADGSAQNAPQSLQDAR